MNYGRTGIVGREARKMKIPGVQEQLWILLIEKRALPEYNEKKVKIRT